MIRNESEYDCQSLIARELQYHLDPFNAADAQADLDNDGLSNLFEYQHNLSISDADTDHEGGKSMNYTKQLNKPLFYIIIGIFLLGVPFSVVGGYFIFYFAWQYLSPTLIIALALIFGVPSFYFIATLGQYFTFIHRDGFFIFKKIMLSKKVRIQEIIKLEIYYPGPTTPEEFNKEDTEIKLFGKRNPSAVRMIFYLRNGETFRVGMTYIPIAEYIRKYLVSRGVICVERYVASLQPERYIDIVYSSDTNKAKKQEVKKQYV